MSNVTCLPRIQVSPNHRFLVTENGEPFFWLGDTAWELFHRLKLDEARIYLHNRSQKRFTVIQAVALAEFNGLDVPNAYGDLPLQDYDPARPNENYYAYIDELIDMAAECELYIGLLPTWGDKVARMWGVGPMIFNPDNAYQYGCWLGERYRTRNNLIWILGGDRPAVYVDPQTDQEKDDRLIWSSLAAGIRAGLGFHGLITYHPMGGHSSSEWLQGESWLDLNMMQSGHGAGHDVPVWGMIERDYYLMPTRPVLDGEPNYEDHPVSPWPTWNPENGYYTDYDVRKQVYRSVFAGGCGVTYGHHSIWQFSTLGREKINYPLVTWREALDRPGGGQVQFLRALLESRPYLSQIPDQSLLVSKSGEGGEHVQATRDSKGHNAMIYLPMPNPVTVNLGILSGDRFQVWWYDPRTGHAIDAGFTYNKKRETFNPPEQGLDWVLVLDEVSQEYNPPGTRMEK